MIVSNISKHSFLMLFPYSNSLASILKPSFFKILNTSSIIHRQLYHSMQLIAILISRMGYVVNSRQHTALASFVSTSLASIKNNFVLSGIFLELAGVRNISISLYFTSILAVLFSRFFLLSP